MITASNISLSYGTQVLFKEVNLKFTPGNCYGIIGANGAGKSTFLKILSGEIEPDTGEIIITPGERLATLKQDHFKYNDYRVIDTVIMGFKHLYDVMQERDAIYSKEDFSEEDGIRAAELEGEFSELGGWEAEATAAQMLDGLGIPVALHEKKMSEIEDNLKVRVLLAQALFGNPDILLLDEPTNHLDLESIHWLEDYLEDFNNTVIVVSHDRHFLNTVCTHICDIDYGRIQLYVGNYDFWYMSSQLAAKQMKDEKKRREEKIAELKEFIQRFSSNVAKAKQATSRKKLIDKLTIDDIKPSSRRFPYVAFKPTREIGKNVLEIKNLSKTIDGEGRMLFSGDEALKDCGVLSGGERVRVVLAKMMLEGNNCLIFDEPTSHLDLESIQALNNGLIEFKGVLLFNSHDHQFVDSLANRIIEFTPKGIIDKMERFDDYLVDEDVKAKRDKAYEGHKGAVVI